MPSWTAPHAASGFMKLKVATFPLTGREVTGPELARSHCFCVLIRELLLAASTGAKAGTTFVHFDPVR